MKNKGFPECIDQMSVLLVLCFHLNINIIMHSTFFFQQPTEKYLVIHSFSTYTHTHGERHGRNDTDITTSIYS